MNRILLIGNSGAKHYGFDGQTIKVRLYLKKIKDEGFDVDFIDLENFSRHPISILRRIKIAIKKCDRIVLITAERGSKILIPYINRVNKKYKKPFIFPLVGTSVLHYSIDKLNEEQKNSFLLNCDFGNIKPKKKLVNELSKITYILPETEQLCEVFKKFYVLRNVYPLTNFRDLEDVRSKTKSVSYPLNRISLDIYGQLCANNDDISKFKSLIDDKTIFYRGSLSNDDVIDRLRDYDIFVFPTRFVGEGVPGVMVESLLAGTPILTSKFPQSKTIINDGYDAISFEMFNKEDLKQKLLFVANNSKLISKLSSGAIETGRRYMYRYVRKDFLNIVCGK